MYFDRQSKVITKKRDGWLVEIDSIIEILDAKRIREK